MIFNNILIHNEQLKQYTLKFETVAKNLITLIIFNINFTSNINDIMIHFEIVFHLFSKQKLFHLSFESFQFLQRRTSQMAL